MIFHTKPKITLIETNPSAWGLCVERLETERLYFFRAD